MNRSVYLLFTACVATLAGLYLWTASSWGLGTAPDSLAYLMAARSIASPADILSLGNHWPPLYPLAISLASAVTGDVISGSRFLHCSLYAANICMLALWCRTHEEQLNWPGMLAVLFFALSPFIFLYHYMSLSEALFLFVLQAFLLSFRAQLHNNTPLTLILCTTLLGLLVLTRYAGIAFVGAAGLWLLLQAEGHLTYRFKRALVFGTLSLSLPTAWLLARVLAGDAGTPRELHFHLIDAQRLQHFFSVPLGWLHPAELSPALAMLIGVALLGLVAHTAVSFRQPDSNMPGFLLFAAGLYIVFLIISISFFDYYTPVNTRVLLPVFVILLYAVALGFQTYMYRLWPVQLVLAGLLLVPTVAGLPALQVTHRAVAHNGSDFLGRDFRSQEILAYIARHQFVKIYSNSPDILQLFFEHRAEPLPRKFDPRSNRSIPEFEQGLDLMAKEVMAGEAVVIWLGKLAWRDYYPTREHLEKDMSLPVLHRAKGGVVLGTDRAVGITVHN